MRFGAALAALLAGGLAAQTPPAFEVASVKPAPPGKDNMIRRSLGGDAGRINYSNVTLKLLIARAYQVKDFQVTGPEWLDSEGYDVMATIPEKTPKDQVPLMLQRLLAERFKLAVHTEKKELPIYALVAGKNGPKMNPAEPEGGVRMMLNTKGIQLQGKMTLDQLTNALSNLMNRPVLDMTELKGGYELNLGFTLDESSGNPRMFGKMAAVSAMGGPGGDGKGPAEAGPDGAQFPSVFAAIEESMGLKLEARRAPVDIVVVDHAEKVPTDN